MCFDLLMMLIDDSTIDAIDDFVEQKSSISIIHYFPQPSSSTPACDTHTDTGLLTIGVRSDVPGLEIKNRRTGEFDKIEEGDQAPLHEMVLFVGQKVPLFSQSTVFESTEHRVVCQLLEKVVNAVYRRCQWMWSGIHWCFFLMLQSEHVQFELCL